jgi:hypothetical protein
MADLRFTVDYSQVKEANKEILKVGSNAQKSASVFEAAFKKAEVQAGKSARAVREQIAFSERLERQKTREANATAAAAAKVANEEERLRRKYVEGYAAMDLYSKELNDIAVARKADIISAEQQRQAVERLNQQMAAGTGVFSAYGAATKGNVKGTNNFGVMMQQAGYQVGDFAVQVQGGTNVAVAFGQQATQLVGALYLLPAPLLAAKAPILGLSLSVNALIASFSIILPIVTGVVAYFMRAAEASRNTKEKVSDFENALSSARGELQGMREDLRLLQSGLESSFILTFSDEVDQAKEALSEARAELAALYDQNVAVGESTANVTNLDDYEESVRLARERLANATLELSTAQEMSRQERQRTRDESVVKQLLEARVILREQEAEAIKKATDRLNEMALAERLIGRGRGLSAGPSAQEIQRNVPAAQLAATEAAEQARLRDLANRSGSSATDPLIGQVEQLEKFLSSERELLLMEYDTRQVTLEQALEKEYITRQQYASMIMELEGKKNKELTDIELKTQQAKVSAVAGGIQDVLNAAANGNQKLLKVARVVGAAEALINTYRAAAQTLANPTIPFYAKFAAAASVVASGLGMVNAIKSGSQASVSGSGAAPSGADAEIPTQATAAPQRVIIEGIDRNSLISGEQLSNIFEALYKENENRGFVFEVAR